MKLGIVGLPNVGKTTLFNALTGARAETGGYTRAGGKANIGTAKVPDPRLDWLAEYYHPKKYSPATIEFVDVPGVGAGSGKANEVFQAIRQVDALVQVVRCFDNDELFLEPADAVRDAHVTGGVPNIVIHVDKRDEEGFASLVCFFELACAISGYMSRVNPFDQPGVEAYKKNMFRMLGKPGAV